MVRRCSAWVLMAALAGGIACTQAAPVQTPDQVVSTFIAAAEKGDWGTADSYLTERFSNALRPGSLPSIWGAAGENVQVRNQEVSGKTAYVWVEGESSLEEAAQRLGLDPLTLRKYLTEPDLADPTYQQLAPQLVGLRLEGDTVTSRLKLTLYRQEGGWRIEVWQPDKPPAEGSQPEKAEGAADPKPSPSPAKAEQPAENQQ